MVYYVAYVCSDCLLQCIQASLVVFPSAGYEGSVMNLVRSGVMIAAAVVVCMAHLVA